MSDISTTTTLSIAKFGQKEAWLRDMIYDDPTILGLGELQAVGKEYPLPGGGRLDVLLKNPDDNAMYEVELQLDETDESHIIRTIEYWDDAKKLWPKRSHTAVLIAEKINCRFFNVVRLLSMAVPIIGIQANIVQIDDRKALHFTKIINVYEEPEDEEPTQRVYGEEHWIANNPGGLECVRWYRNLLTRFYGEIPTKYFQSYVSLTVGGKARVWVDKQNDRVLISVKYVEQDIADAANYLNKEGVDFVTKDSSLRFNVDIHQLERQKHIHEWIVRNLAPRHLLRLQGGQAISDAL